jgi:hypothetical protein
MEHKILLPTGFKPLAIHPVSSRYTKYAIFFCLQNSVMELIFGSNSTGQRMVQAINKKDKEISEQNSVHLGSIST